MSDHSSVSCTDEDADAIDLCAGNEFDVDDDELLRLHIPLNLPPACKEPSTVNKAEDVVTKSPSFVHIATPRMVRDSSISSDDDSEDEKRATRHERSGRKERSTLARRDKLPEGSPVSDLDGPKLLRIYQNNKSMTAKQWHEGSDNKQSGSSRSNRSGEGRVKGNRNNEDQRSSWTPRRPGYERSKKNASERKTMALFPDRNESAAIHINKHFRGSVQAVPGISLAWDRKSSAFPNAGYRDPRVLGGHVLPGMRPNYRFHPTGLIGNPLINPRFSLVSRRLPGERSGLVPLPFFPRQQMRHPQKFPSLQANRMFPVPNPFLPNILLPGRPIFRGPRGVFPTLPRDPRVDSLMAGTDVQTGGRKRRHPLS